MSEKTRNTFPGNIHRPTNIGKEIPSCRTIRRYMDLWKFKSIINKKSLYFRRADKLEDEFEGSSGEWYARVVEEIRKSKSISIEIPAIITDVRKYLRASTYVNCWRIEEVEDALMWRGYTKSNCAVAIETNVALLECSFPYNCATTSDIARGVVDYIDYEKDPVDISDIRQPFVKKRLEYKSENELRLIYFKKKVFPVLKQKYSGVDGRWLPIDFKTLIRKVIIKPQAPQCCEDAVKDILSNNELDENSVTKSALEKKPVF